MTFQQIYDNDQQYIMQTYNRFPVAIEKGRGARLYDFDGKEYIDFASGIGVSSIGYANGDWLSAVTGQAGKLAHTSNLFYTAPMVEAAGKLCALSGMSKVFFANSGAEANEGLIKLARKYSFDKYGKGRHKIITLQNSFHGRTITTLIATGQDHFHNYFFPFTEGFVSIPANNLAALQAELTGDTCAVLMELVQGEGGVLPLDLDYVGQAYALCKEKDILFLVDEVQTGNGRTGTAYSYQQYGILPDAVSTAKGLAGGLPLAAVMASSQVDSVLSAGTHATTFGANPVCCAAACVVLDHLMNPAFLSSVKEKGAYIQQKLRSAGLPGIMGVRGLGLMIGIQVGEGNHRKVVEKAISKGLLAITAGKDTVRLLPPLTISYEEIDAGLGLLLETISEEVTA